MSKKYIHKRNDIGIGVDTQYFKHIYEELNDFDSDYPQNWMGSTLSPQNIGKKQFAQLKQRDFKVNFPNKQKTKV